MSMEFKEFVNCTNVNGKVIVPDDANIKSKIFWIFIGIGLIVAVVMLTT